MMHSAERPNNYFFQHIHTLSGRADKKRSNFCPNFVRNILDLNTAQSISRLNNFITHCLGHSKLL